MKSLPSFLPALFAVSYLATALPAADEKSAYEIAHDQSIAETAAWKTKFAGRDDVLIADGVLADRAAKTVTVLSYATGIAHDESVEFFLTTANSGKDYEALAITFARPSDVVAALKFIGLTAGKPVDFEVNRQWPRGSRVIMSYDINGKAVRAEDCVINSDLNAPLPRSGLVFTGSYTYADADGKTHLAADENESKSIAADYNDSAGVLDVPRRAPQGVVYGFQKPSPALTLKQGQAIPVTLAPATGDAAVVEHSIAIRAALKDDRPVYTIDEGASRLADAADLPHLLAKIGELADGKNDWFTTVSIDPSVKVDDARKLYAVLQAVEKDRGIKIDPPAAGELYYRAFFPDPQWRDRENRLGEPWELFLARRDNTFAARLERMVDVDNPQGGDKKVLQTFPADSPDAFTRQVTANASQWSKAIFVYPPPDITYGELMSWIRPALQAYPQVFVFPALAAASRPATQPKN